MTSSSVRPASRIGAIAARLDRPRTNQKVHRHSYHAGEREQRRWLQTNRFGADEHNARMRAAEDFDIKNRKQGCRNGPLGHIALDVLRLMLRLRNRKTGQLDPSFDWLALTLKRGRNAVVAAVARLIEHGFLDRQRRTELTNDPDSSQYVRQISNAYFFTLPKKVAELVRRMRRVPTEAMRRMAADQDRDSGVAGLSTTQLIADIEDDGLRAIFGRMAVGLSECDSSKGNE